MTILEFVFGIIIAIIIAIVVICYIAYKFSYLDTVKTNQDKFDKIYKDFFINKKGEK